MSGEPKKYKVPLIGTGGNIVYLHRGFCQYYWVWSQVYRSRWILLHVTGYSCVHTDFQHMICLFLYLKRKIPPLQMRGTKRMKHKWTLKWPIRRAPTDGPQRTESLEVPPFHKFCWVSETSLQVYLPMPWIPSVQIYVMLDPWGNFLIILSTAKIILRASISGQNQKARDSSQLSHLLHYLTIIQWYQYINNICVHAC